MAIENFDHGQNKAVGNLTINFSGVGACAATGIRSVVQNGPGEATLELVEAVGESEFFALALRSDFQLGDVKIQWIDDTHFKLETRSELGTNVDGSAWFVIYKVAGAYGAVPVTGGGPT